MATVGGYQIPNPCSSSKDFECATGSDIPNMTDAELAAERHELEGALVADRKSGFAALVNLPAVPPLPVPFGKWAVHRLRLIAKELRRRGRGLR